MSKMENISFQITLPGGERFYCKANESVLEAMRRFGRGPIRHGCFGGGCGVCVMRVVSGNYDVFHRMSRAHVSIEAEKQGVALMCCIKPLSDLTLDVYEGLK